MCGLNLTGMCWSPRLGQENSWMQPDDPPIETLRRFGFRTASVRGRLHRVLSALHTGAGLRFGIEVVDGEDTPAVPGHANPEDLDISGIDVERHESARAPVDAVVAQEDAVLARLHRGMHKAVLLHGADVLVVDIDFGLHASGDQERGFPAHVDASLFRKRIEERRVGKACVSKCRSRGSPYLKKIKYN